MDVFLLPVAPAPPGSDPRFELYCEPATDHVSERAADPAERPRSVFGRWVKGFHQALAEGEAEARRQEDGGAQPDSGSRASRWVKRQLAAAVAEQRLLWHLRHAASARLHHPETIASTRALELAMAEFRRDFDKHRLWCVIDAIIVVASAPLALVPGPNLLAYYFIFRSVGHFFSLRGARKGMNPVLWTAQPSGPLADLQHALSLEPQARAERIDTIAATLGLERLAVFMRRVARRTGQG